MGKFLGWEWIVSRLGQNVVVCPGVALRRRQGDP